MDTNKQEVVWYAAGRIKVPVDHKSDILRFGTVNNEVRGSEIIVTRDPHIPGELLRYSGPYVAGGGNHLWEYRPGEQRNCWNIPGGFGTAAHGDGLDNSKIKIFSRSLSGIAKATHVFAWIEDDQCFGTLVELGYAFAKYKEIFIAHPPHVSLDGELWFAFQTATHLASYYSPELAWADARKRVLAQTKKGGAA